MNQQTVYVFVFDTLSDWEPGYAVAGINNPDMQTQPGRYRVQTFGVTREPVVTAGGMRIVPDLALAELEPGQSAMLILPGGGAWDQGQHSDVAERAGEFLAAGVPVAAICGATAGLARAGLLDSMRHTSNALEYLQATGYQGQALYQGQPAVADGNLITAGATSPLEFAYQIFKRLELYKPEVLDAWYGLFKTGDPAHFFALQKAAGG
jgi:putative intracellular protease/amidase